MSNTLPVSSIKILGTKVPIKYKPIVINESGAPLHGCYEYTTQTIKIDNTEDPASMVSTLIHEIMHAWLHVSGFHEELFEDAPTTEERFVRGFENSLLPIIRAIVKADLSVPLSKEDKANVVLRRSNPAAKGPGTDRPAPGSTT